MSDEQIEQNEWDGKTPLPPHGPEQEAEIKHWVNEIKKKENHMNKIDQLQNALDLLKDQDIDALKNALALIGEPVAQTAPATTDRFDGGSKIKIAILQRGWVAIGRFAQDGDKFTLTDASTIRYWGTTKGLGELVNGPTDKTKLDKAGTMTFERLTVVALMDAEDKAWETRL